MTLKKVIIATNNNHLYSDFWPICAKAWSNIGIHPVLASIGKDDLEKGYGTIINFSEINDIPSGFIAQVIRLIIPCLFPEDVCLIGDIDMIPLNKQYFTKQIENIDNDNILIFSSDAYDENIQRYPMCYIAAKGKYFQQIIGLKDTQEKSIIEFIKYLHSLNLGWDTDEIFFGKQLHKSEFFKDVIFLKREKDYPYKVTRLDRINWEIDAIKFLRNKYIDSHLLRPLNEYQTNLYPILAFVKSGKYTFFSNLLVLARSVINKYVI